MEPNEKHGKEKSLSYLNIMVLILSVYVLVALLVDTFIKLPPQISKLLGLLDDSVCIFFIFDFCVEFYWAENKLKFMRWGWIDLLASVPALPFLRIGRVLRLIRIIRVLRVFRSVEHLVSHVFSNKAAGIFTSISVIAVLMMMFSAISILQVEHDPGSNIKTAEDAIWWSFTTVTSSGNGEKFPVTVEGRIIASLLIVAGKVFFVTFMGYIVSMFILEERKKGKNRAPDKFMEYIVTTLVKEEDENETIDEITRLNNLKKEGAITEEEFDTEKDKLL